MNPNEQPIEPPAPNPDQPMAAPTATFTQQPPSQPSPTTMQVTNADSLPSQAKSKLLFLIIAVVILAALAVGGFLLLKDDAPATSDSAKTDTNSTDTDPSSSGTTYVDTDNGFSFNPGTSMDKADSPYIYSGTPIDDAGIVLMAKNVTPSTSSDEATVKKALQSAKLKSYTGTDPNPVTLTGGHLKGYLINYQLAISGGQNEVWQMGFYSPKSSSVIVLSLITPYLDSKVSDSFLDYAYEVFQSVKLDQ